MDNFTRVIFRVWRSGAKGVIALFPDEDAGNRNCMSYEHIGQHGGASYKKVIMATRPATPIEYASLQEELEKIGYQDLVVVKKDAKRR
jgi:hypothetical protein